VTEAGPHRQVGGQGVGSAYPPPVAPAPPGGPRWFERPWRFGRAGCEHSGAPPLLCPPLCPCPSPPRPPIPSLFPFPCVCAPGAGVGSPLERQATAGFSKTKEDPPKKVPAVDPACHRKGGVPPVLWRLRGQPRPSAYGLGRGGLRCGPGLGGGGMLAPGNFPSQGCLCDAGEPPLPGVLDEGGRHVPQVVGQRHGWVPCGRTPLFSRLE